MTAATDLEDILYKEKLPDVCASVRRKTKNCCSTEGVKNVVPILRWLPKYRRKFLLNDFVAGLTVGLTAIPQAIAYAIVAGLPPQYGLYSAFMGCFVYIFLGTCKDITIGPTAIMSLMVQAHVTGSPDFAVLSCFLAGCAILMMGILNLGALMQFISVPVTTGFTTAAAITIASGQINNLFGISSPSNEFIDSWVNFCKHIGETSRNDVILGISTLIGLLLMRKVKDLHCSCKALIKYISLSRNALAVFVGIILCYAFSEGDRLPFRVGGKITSGIPAITIPPFTTVINGTHVGFYEMTSKLGASLISIPLIAVLESIAVAKAFSKGKILDASQEMIALGVCNFLSAFVSSMPITGSFTRTAINNTSGVKTPLGGLVTGVIVLLTLAFLTETFYYIPKATLSAIIICAMIFMIEYERIAEIWRSKKMDFFPFLTTVICCLFWSLEYGIICGIIANLLFVLKNASRPTILISKHKMNGLEVGLVEIQGSLCYSAAEYLKSKLMKFVATQNGGASIRLLILNGAAISNIDSTVAMNVVSLAEDLKLFNCDSIFWNWKIPAAGVVCRLRPHARKMFRFSQKLEEVAILEKHCEATIPADSGSCSTIAL